MARQALFDGLVIDEQNRILETTQVGANAFYVIDDAGFHRHIDAEDIDRQVLSIFIEQIQNNKDLAVGEALKFLGKDDLFTKAAIDASIDNIDMDQVIAQGMPLQARNMMAMMGFRIIVNYRGEIVDFDQPTMIDE